MRAILKLFLDFIRKPEWVAAVALLIQAVILWLQARILRKHGRTMEEHAGVAKAQAITAELIGNALQQHATILGEQAKLTEAQFKYQRWVVAQAAREKVYDYMLALYSSVSTLIATVEAPGMRLPPRISQEMTAQANVVNALLPAQKATLTCAHLTTEERDYFRQYTLDFAKTLPQTDLPTVIPKLKEINEKYKEFLTMLLKIAQPPEV